MQYSENEIHIFTDGSCHTKHKIGAWAAILLIEAEETLLHDLESETTNNRMELTAVIHSVEYILNKKLVFKKIIIFSDSQYVVNLVVRKEKLKHNKFLTKKGSEIQNKGLVVRLIQLIETINLEFVKVKAHQKKSDERNFNREVDMLSRKIVREYVRSNFPNNMQ